MPPSSPTLPPAPSPAPTPPAPSAPFTSNEFLILLLGTNFNLPEVAAHLTPAQLLECATDLKNLERLQSLLDFNNLCLALRHAKDRHLALDVLRDLLKTADDPVEKRRAATSLLRATTPAKPTAAAPDDEEEAPRPPRPRVSPRADLTAIQVIEQVQQAMYYKNQQQENAGLAALAVFCDDDATVNGEALPTDDARECIEALDDAGITPYQTSVQYWTIDEKVGENKATIPAVFACDHKDTPLKITFKLQRRDVSKHPGCWLITQMTTGIYRNTS